jgi:hypothetical protein
LTTYWFSLAQLFSGVCASYNYTASLAVNWGNYFYPSGDTRHGCHLQVSPGCATRTPIFYANKLGAGTSIHSRVNPVAMTR